MVNTERQHRVIKEKMLGCRVSISDWMGFNKEARERGLSVGALLRKYIEVGKKRRGEVDKVCKQKDCMISKVNLSNDDIPVPDNDSDDNEIKDNGNHSEIKDNKDNEITKDNTKLERIKGIQEEHKSEVKSEKDDDDWLWNMLYPWAK